MSQTRINPSQIPALEEVQAELVAARGGEADLSAYLAIVVAGAPAAHTHPISDVTDLQGDLDAKAPVVHDHDAEYSALGHGHVISDTTGLQGALDAKSATGHAHIIADTTGLQGALDGKAAAVHDHDADYAAIVHDHDLAYADIIHNHDGDYSAPGHGHVVADVTGLQGALDGKSATGHAHVVADVTGLQGALDGKSGTGHGHAIADVTLLQTTLDGKSGTGHGHIIADTTGLQAALDGKSSTSHDHDASYASIEHGHLIADTTGLQTALDGKSPVGHDHDLDYAALVHGHIIADVTGLQGAIDGKSSVGHGHVISDTTGLQTALDGKAEAVHNHDADYADIIHNHDLDYPSLAHVHVIADVTALQTALDGKSATGHGHLIADTTDLQTALDGKAATAHGHVVGDVTGLQGALDGKSATGHGHVIADTTGLQTALDGKSATGHGHVIADTTGLQTALDGKSATGHDHDGTYSPLGHGHVIGDTTGLQGALDAKSAVGHAHVVADVTGLQGALDGKSAVGHGHAIIDTTGLQTALDGKSATGHGHVIADTTGLQAALDGKSATGHGHVIADVTSLQTTLDGKAATAHGHVIADVTGLQAGLDGKSAIGHVHAIADSTGLQTALDGKAPTGHTHPWADVTGEPNTIAGYGITDAYTKTDSDGRYLQLAGGAMSGALTLAADPTLAMHAVTKQYADAIKQGLDIKDSVRVTTTANITLSGTQTIDGVAVIEGNRVLVKNQNTAADNGIYVVAAGAWTRATDADTNAKVTPGMYCFVEEGTANADYGFVLTTNATITLGSTALVFTQFSGAGSITAGNGLTQSGNTISANFTGSGGDNGTAITVARGDHTHAFSALSGKPTTLGGYGITDALNLAGGTLSGHLSVPSLRIGTSGLVEREFMITFPNGAADQKADIYFDSFWGAMEITLSSGYSNADAAGLIRKQYALGLNPANAISTNVGVYTDIGGATATHWALSDVTWDAVESRYRIQIVHRTSTGNSAWVRIRAWGLGANQGDAILAAGASAVYTTDTTVFSTPVVPSTLAWNSGNDGAGSGLDADLLDGYHAAGLPITAAAAQEVVVGGTLSSVTATLAITGVDAGTYKSVLVDTKGRVTAGSNPDTLAGYGITDAVINTRALTAGTGLAGGGNLTADRSFALDGQALALHNLTTSGLIARTGAGTVAGRILTPGSSKLSITFGDGVSGNPTMDVVEASLTLNSIGGTLGGNKGGTGQTSYAIGDILYASAATVLSKLAGVATGNVLISGGVTTAPSWGKVDLTTHISGTLGVTNGGTGLASVAAGSLLYASSANVLIATAPSANNQVFRSSAASAAAWGALIAADIPSLDTAKITSGIFDAARVPFVASRDTRAVNDEPDDFNSGVKFDFKQNATNGLSDSGTYNGVMTWRRYGTGTDFSGGHPIQIAYTDNGNLWQRMGTGAATWGTWTKLKAGTADTLATGRTIAISGKVTGTATTFDGSGNITINTTAATLLAGDIPNLDTAKLTSGTLGIVRGGTGLATVAAGSILYATALNTLTATAPSGANQVLRSTGANALQFAALVAADIPSIDTSKLTSGTLPIARGGTNSTAAATAGGITYGASGAYAFTSAGALGQALISGAANAPTWQTVAAANTASAIVARDGSGNFAAGTITAALVGNASTVTNGVYTTGDQAIGGVKTFSGSIISAAGNAVASLDITAKNGAGSVTNRIRFGSAQGMAVPGNSDQYELAYFITTGIAGRKFFLKADGVGTINLVTDLVTATTFTGALAGNAATVTTNANLTGHVTSVGNSAVLGSFTLAQLNTAVSDAILVSLGGTETITGVKTFGGAGAVGRLKIAGSTSGATTLDAAAVAGAGTVTLPTTGTLATLAGVEVLAGKTLTTPVLGVATATSINKVALTAPATGSTLTIADGKTLTASNTLTLTGTDGSTLAIGTGGTLGTAAYTDSSAYATAGQVNATHTGDATGATVLTVVGINGVLLSSLLTGLLKNATGTGIPSIATAGTDYSLGTSALATGILKSTTATGALSIALAGDFPTLNQSTTGSAATLSTTRSIYGNNFDGSAALAQVIASTFGGTGNGFTKFSGPTTTEKTFTLPDASATILTSNALVTIAQGGTAGNATPTAGALAYGTGAAYAFNLAGVLGQAVISGGAGAPTYQNVASAATASAIVARDASGHFEAERITAKTGFRLNSGATPKFDIVYNAATESLDFNYVG